MNTCTGAHPNSKNFFLGDKFVVSKLVETLNLLIYSLVARLGDLTIITKEIHTLASLNLKLLKVTFSLFFK